jgi:1-acyl-sn-glycerol-3-phosphate acyltransferase
MRKSYAFITALVRLYMKIFWRLKVCHPQRLANMQNCIIAANHISAFDPPFIGSLIPIEIHYLAKWELFKNKLLGALLLSLNCIPIKRGRIDKAAITRVKMVLRKNRSILIFPEGTRKSSRVKSGIGKFAIEAKTDICPVYIENSTDFWGCFWGKKRLKIVIGKKIDSREFADWEANKENFQKLSEYVMKKILELKNDC